MKIKSWLQIIGVATLLVVCVLVMLLLITFRARQVAREKINISNTIVRHVFERRQLTDEYLLFRENRPKEQWLSKNSNIINFVTQESEKFESSRERAILLSIVEHLHLNEEVFKELSEVQNSSASQAKTPRLAARLLFDTQIIATGATELAQISNQAEAARDKGIITLITTILCIVLLAVFLSLQAIWTRMVVPLLKLKKGTEILASGNLDYTLAVESQDEVGQLSHAFNLMVQKLRESYTSLQSVASTDALTGLPNRMSIEQSLFQLAKTTSNMVVMFLDLDRFKNINDTLGHHVGDLILKEVASRFRAVLRENDDIGRLGGDEFMVLLVQFTSINEVIAIAQRLLYSLEAPMNIEGHTLHISTSIGISLFPADGKSVHALLKNADIALYRAKEAGRNRYKLYDESMNIDSYARLALENELRQAIEKNEISAYYQPIVQKGEKLIGIEALMRWQHPTQGLLLPGNFIQLAEETDLIIPLGEACNRIIWSQYVQWNNIKPLSFRVAVNVSMRQFSEINFVQNLEASLAAYGLSPGLVELEITESIAMQNIERSHKKLKDIQAMGLTISIDDFGTGYSSLSYLKTFPINRLKIDKSFVRNCTSDKKNSSIIRAIISLGRSLGIEVIAEGVETKEQFDFLIAENCDGFQGFLFSEAIPAEKFTPRYIAL
ncbi:MAG TPA: EAL domain-containing protein [Patescibacteria group bacterium]|nr:EAL domain-containing protein [Patescibacteria group bacterium]